MCDYINDVCLKHERGIRSVTDVEGFPQYCCCTRLPDVLKSIIPVSLLNFLDYNMKLFTLKLLFKFQKEPTMGQNKSRMGDLL